jgi:hypothetical protein
MGLLLAGSSGGCRDGAGPPTGDNPAKQPAVASPIWPHGDGLAELYAGWLGAPPIAVYLTEDQSLEIIREELARGGVHLAPPGTSPPTIHVPYVRWTTEHEWVSEDFRCVPAEARLPFALDLASEQPAIYVEYISQEDYLPQNENAALGYVGQDLQGFAGIVAREVERQCSGAYCGVFYDPVIYRDDRFFSGREPPEELLQAMKEAQTEAQREEVYEMACEYTDRANKADEERARGESAELLRQQVRDFVEWLKGQGVI